MFKILWQKIAVCYYKLIIQFHKDYIALDDKYSDSPYYRQARGGNWEQWLLGYKEELIEVWFRVNSELCKAVESSPNAICKIAWKKF